MIKKKICFYSGFTLAEVLITLAIIGVVAALTIPSVVRNYQERQIVTQLKKAYSSLSQAFNLAVLQNGDPTGWDLIGMNSAQGNKNLRDKMVPYLKTIKICQDGEKCFSDKRRDLNGVERSISLNDANVCSNIQLSDGTMAAFRVWDKDCKLSNMYCGQITVDLNGYKQPNQLGRDIFAFYVLQDRIKPFGYPGDKYSIGNYCNITKSSAEDFSNGLSCAAWVIIKENMDYLRKVVSW